MVNRSNKCIEIILFGDPSADPERMAVLLESLNLNVQLTLTSSLADGLQVLKHHAFDLILLNLALPDSTGIASLTAVATVAPHVPIIV